MKNQAINLLRGGVFMLAAVAAFAFTQPNPQGVLKAHLGNGSFQVIPEGTMFNCSLSSDVCTARFDENDQQIPGSQTTGTYRRP